MKEIVVISGKGGTGKTTFTSTMSGLLDTVVVADCDVDGTDLHLVVKGEEASRDSFSGGNIAIIDPSLCTSCGKCREVCQFEAITPDYTVKPASCEGCRVCVEFCPAAAISFPKQACGDIVTRNISNGYMVSGHLHPGGENSGKMVTKVREAAVALAKEHSVDTIIIDGPPGIGCPVIASVTGADAAVIVTEPTVSGFHDLKRVLSLADYFRVPVWLVVNRWNVNVSITQEMEVYIEEKGGVAAGRIPWSETISHFQKEDDPRAALLNSSLIDSFRTIQQKILTSKGESSQ